MISSKKPIDVNKISTSIHIPSTYELSVLSSEAYSLNEEMGYSPLPGWFLLYTLSSKTSYYFNHENIKNEGYYGKLFVKVNNDLYQAFVIAHRGTVLHMDNIIRDIQVLFKIFNSGDIELISNWVSYLINSAISINIPIYNTGHSLGAVYADLLNYWIFDFWSRAYGINPLNRKSITFENPGSKEIIRNIFRDWRSGQSYVELYPIHSEMYQAYNADINIINCCNENAGKTFKLADLPYKYNFNSLNTMNPNVYLNFPYYVEYTFQQHGIDNIKSYIQGGGKIIEYTYPNGIQNSYISWLNGDVRKVYWEGYFKHKWEQSPLDRELFKKFESFLDHNMQILENVHDKALALISTPSPLLSPVYIHTAEKKQESLKTDSNLIPIYIDRKDLHSLSKQSMFSINKDSNLIKLETAKEENNVVELPRRRRRIKCSIL